MMPDRSALAHLTERIVRGDEVAFEQLFDAATSGAAQEFVGSNFFCGRIWAAVVRCPQVVAAVNLDMIGSEAGDSLAIDDADDLELAAARQGFRL